MSAFLIVEIIKKNEEKFAEYAAKATETVKSHGGEFLIRGKAIKTLVGEQPEHEFAGLVKFPDIQSIDDWYGSDEYQAIIGLRDEGADVKITVYQAPPE